MFNWVRLLLRSGYYFGQAIGVGNFEIDWRTGRVFTSTRSTLYAAANNFTFVVLIALQFTGGPKFFSVFGGTTKMYAYVESCVTILWSSAGLVILLNQWRHQSQLMILARSAIQLCRVRPRIMRISRWRILFKFINSILAYIFPFFFALSTIEVTNLRDLSGFVQKIWISAIVILAIAQYFLMMVCVWAHYILLNKELHQVVEASRKLSCDLSRKGAFMTKCCSLADQLEDIAKLQSRLQSIVDKLDAVFGIPKFVVYCCYYAASVVTIYTTYNTFKQNLGMNLRDIIFFYSWSFFYCMDGIQNLFMDLHVQDEHQEMIRLLGERTLFASDLDVRLEESFESLQLQLIRNPLKMDVLQLFTINRFSTWAMFASILLHSICLVQYDLENFSRN